VIIIACRSGQVKQVSLKSPATPLRISSLSKCYWNLANRMHARGKPCTLHKKADVPYLVYSTVKRIVNKKADVPYLVYSTVKHIVNISIKEFFTVPMHPNKNLLYESGGLRQLQQQHNIPVVGRVRGHAQQYQLRRVHCRHFSLSEVYLLWIVTP